MSARPTPSFCIAGSTVMGPTPLIELRSSRKLLPTILPSDFGNQIEETFVTYETGQKARHQSIRLL